MTEPQPQLVDGLTFEQYVARESQHTTPAKATEIAALVFGLGGDVQELDAEQPQKGGESDE